MLASDAHHVAARGARCEARFGEELELEIRVIVRLILCHHFCGAGPQLAVSAAHRSPVLCSPSCDVPLLRQSHLSLPGWVGLALPCRAGSGEPLPLVKSGHRGNNLSIARLLSRLPSSSAISSHLLKCVKLFSELILDNVIKDLASCSSVQFFYIKKLNKFHYK